MRCRAWVSSYVDGINVQKEALTRWNRRILGQCREEVLSVRKTKGEGWLREREAGENLRFFFFCRLDILGYLEVGEVRKRRVKYPNEM